ncbi:GNAT family N-acetyltransferase [Alicyclobacillus ferrooxydans]|uniref:GNAT family acetyltransferase n=1 Tax=Alicyclobacillus ferrooxydans TaxID=471514 RepID=A0A0P9CAE0_9BACL|nr:GNAT family protein [Alicyclobacillus ferrooxydans]KPV42332.1 GNAT family acetyltransferase [Alicyclobacillus ferrooxydans]
MADTSPDIYVESHLESIEFIGKRAKLVGLCESHVEGLMAVATHQQIWTYMPTKVASRGALEALVRDALAAKAAGTEFPFVIIDQATNRVVGSTRFLDISRVNKSLEIGWTWLSPDVWRTSINTECKYLLLKYCFETLNTIRVQLKTDLRNVRSQTAIERIGGVKEGVLRKHRILADGYIRDSVYYSIVDSEWPTVKERLELMLQR